jgi:nitrite reductase/ring-hydroxylating ferredoxin subunit
VRHVVAPVADFPAGTRQIVRLGGREIGVFHVGGRFYAMRNRCPHQGGPLCAGRILPRIVSAEPGGVATAEGTPRLACPWHGWQYDMETGESYAQGDPNARTYPVSVERGPYVAETFRTYVAGDYVVVEV